MTVAEAKIRPFTASLACVPPGRSFRHHRFCDDQARRQLVRRFHGLPRVDGQLPRRLPGGYVWSLYRAICPTCLADVPAPDVHGHIVQLVPSVLTLDGLFWCGGCRHLAPIQVRIRDEGAGRAAIEFQHDGAWWQEDAAEVYELNPDPELTLVERGYVKIGVAVMRVLARLRERRKP